MRSILGIRGLVGVWFATRILMIPSGSWGRTLDVMVDYLVADGAVALLVGLFFAREAAARGARREEVLSIILLIDGCGRLLSGVAAHVWPGLTEFPVTAAAFLGIMAMCTAAVGGAEAILVMREESVRHQVRNTRAQFPAGPVGVAAIASMAFGVSAAVSVDDPDLMRRLLVGHIAAAAAVTFSLAWSRRQRAREALPTAPAA